MPDWVRVADEKEVTGVHSVDANGREFVLFRLPDGIFALDNVCSHEYARLSEGEIWGDRVYCPKHGSSFDIRTGRVSGLPATKPVESVPVKIEKGGVYVHIEDWY